MVVGCGNIVVCQLVGIGMAKWIQAAGELVLVCCNLVKILMLLMMLFVNLMYSAHDEFKLLNKAVLVEFKFES